MTIGLFDWDAFVYRAAFAAQKIVRHVHVDSQVHSFESARDLTRWCEDNEYEKSELEIVEELVLQKKPRAIKILKSLMNRSAYYLHCSKCELYLTGENNFRNILYPEYKANRADRPKPHYYKDLIDYSVKSMGAVVVDGYEADDELVIRAEQLEKQGKEWVIISPDKDLKTYPGTHFSPFEDSPEKGYSIVDPLEASFNFYSQVLTGDGVDNIPGIYGVGKTKANKMLEDCLDEKSMWKICLDQYAERGIGPKEVIRNARLLHMLRHKYDLWNPPE